MPSFEDPSPETSITLRRQSPTGANCSMVKASAAPIAVENCHQARGAAATACDRAVTSSKVLVPVQGTTIFCRESPVH